MNKTLVTLALPVAIACGGGNATAPPAASPVSPAPCEPSQAEALEPPVADDSPSDSGDLVASEDEPAPAPPSGPRPGFPSAGDALEAVLQEFPEAYSELAKVRFETGSRKEFVLDDVMVLVPAAKLKGVGKAQLKTRACAAKKRLGLDCACETVELAPVKNYAWDAWPDKRVVPVTVRFFIGC